MGVIKDKVKELNTYERMSQNYFIGDAVIKKYDPVSNTASIEYSNPNGSGTLFKSNVPVMLRLENIKIGVKCTILFQGGNVNAPAIIGLCDIEFNVATFNQKSDIDEGGLLVDQLIDKVDVSSNTTPMIEDYESTEISYFGSDYIKDRDLDQEVQKMLYFIGKNSNEDININNVFSKSNIKVCKNGDIRIFVNNNTGILINNETKEIQLYGKISVNGKTVSIDD